MDTFHIFAMETEHFECEALAGLAEETHDRLFAEKCRQDGHAEGDLVSLRFHFETTILREAFFIEFQIGEYLNTRDDAGGGSLG